MTVEEIEIIVTAKVEEALKEFNKIVPTVQKKMKEVQESFSKVDAREMKSQMQNAVNFAKRKIQDLKKSSENNKIAITVTNKDAKKQITQLEKEINSLQAKIRASQSSLKSVKVKISTIEDDTSIKERTKMATKTGYKKNYTKQEFNMLDNNINNSLSNNSNYTYAIKQQEILNKNIEEYTAQIEVAKRRLIELSRVTLPKRTITGARTMNIENPDVSIWNTLESKIKSTLQAVKQSFSNVFSGKDFKSDDQFDLGKSENQLRLIDLKIDKLETKIKNAQKGKIELSDEDIAKAEVELDRLYNQKEKIEKSSGGNFFSKLFLEAKKTKPVIEKITAPLANIKNQVNKMNSGLKNGLGHVIKYAAALFSLRGIYSILSNSAQSWLSSQNAGAKQLSANIEYVKYAMGSVFAPVIQYVTSLVYQLMKAIQSVVYAMSGVNIFAKTTASSMKNTSSSAKQASKSLSSVHSEINNVSDSKNSGGSSSTPNIDLSKMENTPSSIIDAIKNGNWYEVGETIGQKINDAMNSIPWDKIQSTAKNIGTNIAQFLNGGIKAINWNQVGNTFAQGINTAIYFAYNFVITFDWKQFGKAIGDSINGFFNSIDWTIASQTLSEGIKGVFNTIYTAIETIDWQQLAKDTEEFVLNIDWNGVAQAFFRGIGAAFGGLEAFIGQLEYDLLYKIGEYFQGWIDRTKELGGNIVDGILMGILYGIGAIATWINDNIFEPFVDGFKNAFGIHSPSTVMIEMGGYIIDGLKIGLLGIWDKVKQPFIDFKNNLINKFAEIKSNISDWTENTKTTISNWGNDVKSKISLAWNNASQNVNSSVNSLKNNISTGLNNAKITVANWGDDIKNTFSNLGRNASTWGKDLADNMASGIKNNIHKVTSAVSSVANKIKDYLHFTEPDTGPLSNFHTYMPDMIDLMVKGIKDNTNKVKNEMENLAGTMSYTINTEPLTSIDTTTSRINPINGQSSNFVERFEDALSGFNISNNTDRPIYLTVNVGDKKLGQILLDDLRDKTRRTGKDIEALIGG